MNFQEKEAVVADLHVRFRDSAAAFLVDYKGCGCAALTELRRELRTAGATLAIVKNTLAKRAVQETEAAELGEQFTGSTAVVWSEEDPVVPAKALTKFAKSQESFVIRAGMVDGQVIDAQGVSSLAELPSKEEVLAKLLAMINAPATRLLQTINAPAGEVARLLEAWRGELEKRGE